MKPITALALAGLAAAQLPSFADSLNLVDSFMRDLQISFHEVTGLHPRRAFHRRSSGKLAKRCIRRPSGYPGPGGNSTTTTRSSSTATRTSTRASSTPAATPSILTLTLTSTSTPTPTPTPTLISILTSVSISISTSVSISVSVFTSISISTPTPTPTPTPTSTSTSASTRTSTRISTSTSTSTSGVASPTPSSTWKLRETIAGNDFFNAWTFWSLADPTNGAVDYQTREGCESAGLISVNSDGNAIMRVETTPQVSGNRKSVRVHSNTVINGGLVILDAVHMPYGCGTWPAFWSNGPNWPDGGEIDIVEGVNGYTMNQASLHTKSGCTIPENYGSSGMLAAGGNCAAHETGNQGCGQLSSKANNYGKTFNDNGGGVYAMRWDKSGISVFFFPRGDIPSDITNETPQPDKWGMPVGNWPAQNCDPFEFMKDHIMIFDTTLCGDWAGNAWQSSGIAGQTESCAASTGYGSCLDYIRNEGGAFKDAYWEVKSVKVYT